VSEDSDHTTEKVLVGHMSQRDGDLLRRQLDEVGIASELVIDHKNCSTGCTPQWQLWVHAQDLEQTREFFQTRRQNLLESLGADPRLLEMVFDPSKPMATCPACGFEFATSHGACPECGLNFGA
jgi:hypothetical protein